MKGVYAELSEATHFGSIAGLGFSGRRTARLTTAGQGSFGRAGRVGAARSSS